MHSHQAQEVDDLLNNYLPFGYTSKVQEKAKSQGIEFKKQRIRSVKSLIYVDLTIMNFIIEVAKDNKAIAEASKEKLNELLPKKV